MALVKVYTRPAQVLHSAPLFSATVLFFILVILLTYIPPFFIAYFTGGFWQYESFYSEQANVRHSRDVIASLGSCGEEPDKLWSTFRDHITLLREDALLMPVVKSHEFDNDRDGLNDALKLTLTFSMEEMDFAVCSFRALLFFDIKLSKFSRVQLQSVVYVSSVWSSPSSKLWVGGRLGMRQTLPLPNRGTVSTYNVSLLKRNSQYIEDYAFTSILSANNERNITTHLDTPSYVWEPGQTGSFTVDIDIHYSPWSILYRPGFWQLVKVAWIQYAAIAGVFYIVFRAVKAFMYNHQVVRTIIHSEDIKLKSD